MSRASVEAAHSFATMPEAYRANGVPCPSDCTCRGMVDQYVSPIMARIEASRDTMPDDDYADLLKQAAQA